MLAEASRVADCLTGKTARPGAARGAVCDHHPLSSREQRPSCRQGTRAAPFPPSSAGGAGTKLASLSRHRMEAGFANHPAVVRRSGLSGTWAIRWVPLCSPVTHGPGPRLQFHTQCCLLQRAHASLQSPTDGLLPRQPLETADVFYREMGVGQQLELFEHDAFFTMVGVATDDSRMRFPFLLCKRLIALRLFHRLRAGERRFSTRALSRGEGQPLTCRPRDSRAWLHSCWPTTRRDMPFAALRLPCKVVVDLANLQHLSLVLWRHFLRQRARFG